MFLGRKKELSIMEESFCSKKFEFLVLYGRRRIGKTSLLKMFAQKHNALFFSAQEKNDALNLVDFSRTIQEYFEDGFFSDFSDWETAFRYITAKCNDLEKLVLIIDEFPFIAIENPSIKSILQHTIDHFWKEKNIFLILCGSSVSFMEDEILAHKSPLFGRSTVHIELKGFDYYESSKFFPEYSSIDKLITYGILGGVPSYLDSFDKSKTVEKNIASKILREGSFLKDEPVFILRQELREPRIYNSILEAIASGSTKINEIASKIHEEPQKCSKYLNTLCSIQLIKKVVPCNEESSSRKSIYRICDNYLLFWYHFLFKQKSYYEIIGEEKSASEIMKSENINLYMGRIFEEICLEYMICLAKNQKLPFIPVKYGKWWGNNPARKMQDDIDVLLIDKSGVSFIICECKFKNEPFDKGDFETMLSRRSVFPFGERFYFYAFSKSGFSDWVYSNAANNDVKLLMPDDLFFMQSGPKSI
nr:ATP-binding protein [uncultured Treponema sp.]